MFAPAPPDYTTARAIIFAIACVLISIIAMRYPRV